MNEELAVEQQMEATYAVSHLVPSCAIWNLLNKKNKDGSYCFRQRIT